MNTINIVCKRCGITEDILESYIQQKMCQSCRRYNNNLHLWVARKLGKPAKCEHCGVTEGRFEWSNKSQLYKKELDDWQRLCSRCHKHYDNIGKRLWATRRSNNNVSK